MHKLRFLRTLLASLSILILLSSPAFSTDYDGDNIPDEHESYLAEKYKPHYIFHPGERFFYMDPNEFLNKTGEELNEMFSHYNSGKPFNANHVWRIGCGDIRRDCGTMADFTQLMSRYNQNNIEDIEGSDQKMYDCIIKNGWANVRITASGPYDKSNLKNELRQDVPIFYLVERNAEGNIELQFWQFSHMDTKDAVFGIRDHMFDWSRVVLVFAAKWGRIPKPPNQLQEFGYTAIEPPLYTYYSAHRTPINQDADSPFQPRYLLWPDVHKYQDTHPIVLVARNDHELYYENDVFSWTPGKIYMDQAISCDGNCFCVPLFVQDHLTWLIDYRYYDHVGVGRTLDPTNLVNIGSGVSPNWQTIWMKFGGKWGNGPEGPLGSGAYVRFRQHNVWGNAERDGGSVCRTYQGLIDNGTNEREKYCYTVYNGDAAQSLVKSVFQPQGFDATADAYINKCFGQSLFPYCVKTRFSVSMKNTGPHVPLSESNCIAVRYRGWPNLFEEKVDSIWDGHDAVVLAFTGTPFYFSEKSTGSTETHYWEVEGPKMGSEPASCWITLSIPYNVSCNVIEKAKVDFVVSTIPGGTAPFKTTLKVKPNVQLGGYPYIETHELTTNQITSLELPAGANCWWAPEETLYNEQKERWINTDHSYYNCDTVTQSDTITIKYYHQYKADVRLLGTSDFVSSVNLEKHVCFGDTLKKFNIYDRWINWCDPGSELTFSACLSFYPVICTNDPHSFIVNQPIDTAINYAYETQPDFNVIQVTQNSFDESNLGLSGYKLVWESREGSSSHVWLYDYEKDSLVKLSDKPEYGALNYKPDIDGDLVAWVTVVSDTHRVIMEDLSTGQHHEIKPGYYGIIPVQNVDVNGRRVGWVCSEPYWIMAEIYDFDSARVVRSSSGHQQYTWSSGPIVLSGQNAVFSEWWDLSGAGANNWSIPGIFPPFWEAFGFWEGIDNGATNEKIDTKIFAVPSLSGYDVAYVGQELWATQRTTLEYADMTSKYEMNYHYGGPKLGKHYTLVINNDTLSDQNISSVPQVSGGYLSYANLLDSTIHYLYLEDVKNNCSNAFITTDSTTDRCYEYISSLWQQIPGHEFHMSGNNFAVVDRVNGSDYCYFYHGNTQSRTTLSKDSYPKKSPQVSLLNSAWLAYDGNDWEVFMAVFAPKPETLLAASSSINNGNSTCHIDSITGSGFHSTSRVFLVNGKGNSVGLGHGMRKELSTQPIREKNFIEAINVKVSSLDRLSCDFDLKGVEPGEWGILILNPDGQIGATRNKFEVKAESPPSKSEPTFPADGSVKQPSDLMLGWSKAAAADSYFVYLGQHPDSLALIFSGETTNYVTSGLVNLETYYWRVDTKNFGGVIQGDVRTFTTICALPEPSSNPSPAPGTEEVPPGEVRLSWSPVAGTDSFRVLLWNATDTNASSWSVIDTFLNVKNLLGLTRYYWKVVPINSAGSAEAETWAFQTMPTSAPAAPAIGYPKNNDSNMVDLSMLSWERCDQAAKYRVNFGLTNPPPYVATSYDPESELDFLMPDTIYYWQVTSVNSIDSARGPVWSFRTGNLPFTLLAPESLYIKSVDSQSIGLKWSRGLLFDSYQIFRTGVATADTLCLIASTSETTFVDSSISLLPSFARSPLFYGVKGKYRENSSLLSDLVGKFDQELVSIPGLGSFNTLSLPLNNDSIIDASALAKRLPACDSLSTWDVSTQRFMVYRTADSLTNFKVLPWGAYGASQSSGATWTLTGSLFSGPQFLWTSDKCDFNLIAIPLTILDTLTASSMCSMIPCCNSCVYWDAQKQGFIQHVSGLDFNNFSVRPGMSYFVSVSKDTVWSISHTSSSGIINTNTGRSAGKTIRFQQNDRVNAPHLVYGEADELIDSISASLLWIPGLTLTEHTAGSGILDRKWFLQVGSPYYCWKAGDTVLVEVFAKGRIHNLLVPLSWKVVDSLGIPVHVDDNDIHMPKYFALYQSYPNPFNPVTNIRYDLPKPCNVNLIIYNILGQKIRVLVNERQTAGFKSVLWDGKDGQGRQLTSGIYFYRIQAGDFAESKKMVLIK